MIFETRHSVPSIKMINDEKKSVKCLELESRRKRETSSTFFSFCQNQISLIFLQLKLKEDFFYFRYFVQMADGTAKREKRWMNLAFSEIPIIKFFLLKRQKTKC